MDASDGVAHILVGGSRHGARVQDYNLRVLCGFGAGQSALDELAFNGGSIGLRSPASEIFHVEPRHDFVYYSYQQSQHLRHGCRKRSATGKSNYLALLSIIRFTFQSCCSMLVMDRPKFPWRQFS
jgi:hypothetical protein